MQAGTCPIGTGVVADGAITGHDACTMHNDAFVPSVLEPW